jgi:hypothetical protein
MTKAYAAIRSFLDKQNIVRQTTKEKPALPARLPAPHGLRRRSASGPKLGKQMARVRPAPKRNAGRAIR